MTTTDPTAADVLARLAEIDAMPFGELWIAHMENFKRDAVNYLRSPAFAALLADRERLREALEPLAAACDNADKSASDRLYLGMGVMSDNASPGWGASMAT